MQQPEEMLILLAKALVQGASVGELPKYACSAAAEVLECTGAAIALGDFESGRILLCASESIARAVEEVQEIAAQGPSIHAYGSGRSVSLAIDGDDDLTDPRWPLLSLTTLREYRPLTVLATPLKASNEVIGTLTLVKRGVADCIDEEAALDVARLVTAVVLASAPSDLNELFSAPWNERAEIFQATGMVMAQLRLGEQDALALLKAHSFAAGVSLTDTARDVLARRLILGGDAGDEAQG
ncbi:MAG: ANTAR domain-containing protein [Dermatophilus congolensis]|nr:ANTAR domain-containing protein [Dermatophilus congolensis]